MPIKKLPKNVSSKIAAGEVVERPVSVIKELIENAIDAQSSSISIKIKGAGRKLIEVSDNGVGIPHDEIALSVERYATSKIISADDLQLVRTLGFRGEALASIAAVSRFIIESRHEKSETGIEMRIEGGDIVERKEIGRSTGTKITVADLFFNVPARLKFLKSDRTERSLINRVIARYALYYATIQFSLFQDGKQVLLSSGGGDRTEILSKIFSVDTAKKMVPVSYNDEYLSLSGYTSPFSLTRASRKEIFFFINGRLVADSGITAAITKSYQGLIMVGRYPISALFIDIDPKELDVNVHPTKTEIRLKDPSGVFSAVHTAVRKTISAYALTPTIPMAVWKNWEKEELPVYENQLLPASQGGVIESGSAENTGILSGTVQLPMLRLIGQLGQTYLAAEGPDGLYLIDQHAAHERILFEKLLSVNDSGMENSQLLLEPCVLKIPDMDAEDLHKKIVFSREVGFKIEDFGPNTIKILGIPQILSKHDPEFIFINFIEAGDDEQKDLLDQEKKEVMVKRICKRLAVKAGQTLSASEQQQMILDLENCRNPRTCPHGRPTIIHISVNTLERRFGRTGSI